MKKRKTFHKELIDKQFIKELSKGTLVGLGIVLTAACFSLGSYVSFMGGVLIGLTLCYMFIEIKDAFR